MYIWNEICVVRSVTQNQNMFGYKNVKLVENVVSVLKERDERQRFLGCRRIFGLFLSFVSVYLYCLFRLPLSGLLLTCFCGVVDLHTLKYD